MAGTNDPPGAPVRSGGTVIAGDTATQPGRSGATLPPTIDGSSVPASVRTHPGTVDALGDGEATVGGRGAGGVAPVGAPAPGSKIGPFVVERTLGSGAMGVVLLATDPELARPVAIKVLSSDGSDDGQQRLVREAQATARLSHPNVVAVHQAGTWEGRVFIVMEYVDGGTLRQWLQQQRRPWREVVAAFEQAGRGLAAAHASGLVHRDFKPDNVLVGRDGRVRVSDFGLVGLAGGSAATTVDAATQSSLDVGITRTGALLGTPAYMAPEQFDGARVDARADQFAFAVALFEALYGRRPFDGETPANLLFAAMSGQIYAPPPSDVPAQTHAAIVRALAADPNLRHASVDAMLAALKPSEPRPRRAKGIVVAAVGGVVVAAAGGGALAVTQPWAADAPAAQVEGGRADAPVSCAQRGQAIATVWNDDVRSVLRERMQSAAPTLEAAPARLVDSLDRFAHAWAETATAGCVAQAADESPGEVDLALQAQCLDDRRLELAALVEVIADGEGALVVGAGQFVHRLPPVETCGDLGALRTMSGAFTELSTDARQALRRQRARAVLQIGAGSYVEAFDTAVAGVGAARELGDPLALARMLVAAAQAAQPLRRLGRGEAFSTEALGVAAQLRAHELEAEAALVQLQSVYGQSTLGPVYSTVGLAPSKIVQAAGMLASVQAAVRQSRRADHLPRLLLHEANVALAGGDAGTARTQADLAVGSLAERGIAGPDLARAHILRATIAMGAGEAETVAKEFASARSLLAPLASDHRPDEATMLFAEAVLLLQDNPSVGAPEKLRDASRIYAAIDPQHPQIRRVNTVLGKALRERGKHAAAFKALDTALANARRQPIASALVLLEIIALLGPTAIELGRWDDATRITDEGAELVRATYGTDSDLLAAFDGQRALILQAQGEFDASLPHLQKALDRYLARVGSLNPRTREPLVALATTYAYLDRCAEAQPHIRSMEAIDRRTEAPADSASVRLRLARALCALADGNAHAAETEVATARREIWGLSAVGPEPAFAAYVAAKVALKAGHFASARGEAAAAKAGFEQLGPPYAAYVDGIEALARAIPAPP